MFNQYIFEKQLKKKTLEKINNEKIVKMKKIHLKQREELSKKYYEKVNNFMLNMIDNPIVINDNNNSLLIHKQNETDKHLSDRNLINIINQLNINENSKLYMDLLDFKKEFPETMNKETNNFKDYNHLDKLNDNNNVLNQPLMKFKPRNDCERILDSIYFNRGNYKVNNILKNSNEKNKYKFEIIKNYYNKINNNGNKNNSTYNIFLNNSKNKLLLNSKEQLIKIKNNIKNNSVKKKILGLKKNDNLLKNKIKNSKLIKNITENYHSKSYFKGLEFSIITNKNKIFNNKKNEIKLDNKLNKSANSFEYLNYFTPNNKKTEDFNLLTFYYNDVKRFQKSSQRLILENAVNDALDKSSDSSINDNGQEEIIKKVILLKHPKLGESVKKNKNLSTSKYEYYKNLNYLKKLSVKEKNKNKPKLFMIKKYKLINDENKNEIINGVDINNIGYYVLKKCNIIRSKYNNIKINENK